MNFASVGARWLWLGKRKVNTYLHFRQEFKYEGGDCRLFISADTNAVVSLNGAEVGSGMFLSYPEHKYFETYDLNAVQGKNTLDILVYYQGVTTQCYYAGAAGAIWYIQCDDELIPNTEPFVTPATNWKQGEIELITGQLGPSFAYDATKSEGEFKAADVLPFSKELPEEILPRPIKPLDISGYAAGELIRLGSYKLDGGDTPAQKMQFSYMKTAGDALENIWYLYDLGGETAGYIDFEIEADEVSLLYIGYGEHLEDLRVRTYVGSRNFAFSYKAKTGRQHFTCFTRRLAGRYIQLFADKPIKIISIGLRTCLYPIKMKPLLQLEDALDAKIYAAGINTMRMSMHDHYEDCPWREQCLYAMDGFIQFVSGLFVFDNAEFIRASLELLRDSVGKDGYTDICAPCTKDLVIPSFSVMWLIFASEYAMACNDKPYAEKILPTVKTMLGKYLSNLKDGLYVNLTEPRYWNFYDWADGLSGNLHGESNADIEAPINLLLLWALKDNIQLCRFANDGAGAEKMQKQYSELKDAINKAFLDADGTYFTRLGSTHKAEVVQAYAIHAAASDNPALLRTVLADKNNGMVPVTLSTATFRYAALLQDKKYGDMVLKEVRDIWGGMLFKGATTFYEVAEGASAFADAGSLCHGWSSVPVYVYHILNRSK